MLRKFKQLHNTLMSVRRNKLRFNSSQASSVQQTDFQILQQKAYISTKIIAEIRKDRTWQELKTLTLTESIINLINQSKQISPAVKDMMLRFFTGEGVPLDPIFATQKRIPQLLATKDRSDNKNIVYRPNYTVTKKIFDQFYGYTAVDRLIFGHFGIAKTVALTLFWSLSNFIIQYKLRQKQSNGKLKPFLQKLPPKLFYWSIEKEDTEVLVKKLFKQQCPQIFQTQLTNQYHLEDPELLPLKSFYQQNAIPLLIAIDQIHQLIAIKRQKLAKQELISECQRIQDKEQSDLSKKQKDFIKNNNQTALVSSKKELQLDLSKFNTIFRLIRRNFYHKVFYSSVDIEKQIFQSFDFGFNGHHSKINRTKMEYAELLPKKSSIIQLLDFFLFEFKNKVNLPFLKVEQFEALIKYQLYQYLTKRRFEYILTPYFISFKLNDIRKTQQKNFDKINEKLQVLVQKNKSTGKLEPIKSNIKDLNKDLSQDEIKSINQAKDRILKTLADVIKYSVDQTIERLKIFLQKGQKQIKRRLLSRLYSYMYMVPDKNQGETQKDLYRYKIDLKLGIKDQDMQKTFSHHLFCYEQNQRQLYSLFPMGLIEKLIQPFMEDAIRYNLRNFDQDNFKDLDPTSLGLKTEKLLIDTLVLQNKQVRFPTIGLQFNKIFKNKLGFKPIPQQRKKDTQTYHFIQSFVPYLSLMNKGKENTAIFLPLNADYHDFQKHNFYGTNMQMKHIDRQSKSIDFIVAQINQDTIDLYAFDTTINNKPAMVRQKINMFLENADNFGDIHKNQITLPDQDKPKTLKLSYFVISPHKQCEINLDTINKISKQKFQFKSPILKPSNIFKVNRKTKQGRKCILDKIGYITFGRSDLTVFDLNAGSENRSVAREEIQFFVKFQRWLEKYIKTSD